MSDRHAGRHPRGLRRQSLSDFHLTIAVKRGGVRPELTVTWTGEPEEFARLQQNRAFQVVLQALAG